MNEPKTVTAMFPSEGAALALESIDEYSRENFVDKTYRFVRRVMRNPEYRELIQKRAAEIREQGLYT